MNRMVLDFVADVAPRVGAWIEMFGRDEGEQSDDVAPRVGAWIEIAQ